MNRFRKYGFQLIYGMRFTKREDDVYVSPPVGWAWVKYQTTENLFWFNDKEHPNQHPIKFVRDTFRVYKP